MAVGKGNVAGNELGQNYRVGQSREAGVAALRDSARHQQFGWLTGAQQGTLGSTGLKALNVDLADVRDPPTQQAGHPQPEAPDIPDIPRPFAFQQPQPRDPTGWLPAPPPAAIVVVWISIEAGVFAQLLCPGLPARWRNHVKF